VLLALIVAAIGISAVFLPLIFVVGIAAGLAAMLGPVVAAVILAVAVLAMVGVYGAVIAFLFATVSAVVVEGKGPAAAILRSVELARGALARIFGVVAVAFGISYLPILGVLAIIGAAGGFSDPEAMLAPGSHAMLIQQAVSMVATTLTTPFLAAVLVVQYYDRRVRTEGLDVQDAADRLRAV
jgi:hypothetical protein